MQPINYFNMVRKSSKHPIKMKTSLYVNLPFFMVEEQHITEKSEVEYERVGNGIIVKVGDVK